ncbi:MAG: ABC transporter ATP-binding protein [Candidatus Hydrogenedentota bacterium]
MPPCIQIKQLRKKYGPNVAVNDLTLDIEQGEVFGLLGPNGAGKSTTLYMLMNLVRPTSGEVLIFGKNIRTNFIEIASRMGVLVERPTFYEHLTVSKNLKLTARLARKEVTISRALDLAGLLHLSNERVSTLSHGIRQRLGLALAFLTEPELLILDEPTSGLDVEHTQEILHTLRHLADEANVTIVISSHMMHEVESLCDRVAIINQGNLLSCDNTDVLLSYDKALIEVHLDAPEAAAKRLNDETWVEVAEAHQGKIIVHLTEPNPHHLITYLVSNGYQISAVIPRRRTLQEYFLKVLNS